MNYDDVRLKMEIELSEELKNQLQIDAIDGILQQLERGAINSYYHNLFDNQYFKISPILSPSLYDLCIQVKNKLEFKEDIDFYITALPDLNAISIPNIALQSGESHIVAINSSLIEILDDVELKFVIGHEIGHLISKNAKIRNIIKFIFQDNEENIPLILKNKISFWNRMSELSADRFGLIASGNLEKVVTSFFKLSSGISTNRINFDFDEYLNQNRNILENNDFSPYNYEYSHPINPLRLEAISKFAKSDLYKSILRKRIINDVKLADEMEELLQNSYFFFTSELDIHRANFIVSGGILLANIDNDIAPEELETIINSLAQYILYPKSYIDYILKTEDLEELFADSIKAILENNPGEAEAMLDYLINIALKDGLIKKVELDLIFDIGQKILGISKKKIARLIAFNIQEVFKPKYI